MTAKRTFWFFSGLRGLRPGFRNLFESVGRVHSNTWLQDCQKHVTGADPVLEVLKPLRLLLERECLMYLGFSVVPFLREMAAAGFDPCVDPLPDPNLASRGSGSPCQEEAARLSTRQGLAYRVFYARFRR